MKYSKGRADIPKVNDPRYSVCPRSFTIGSGLEINYSIAIGVYLPSPYPAWSKIRSHCWPILINFGPKTLFYVRLIWRHCDPFNRSAGVGRVGALPAHSSSVAQSFLSIIQGRPRVRSNER